MEDELTRATAAIMAFGYRREDDGSLVKYKGSDQTRWLPRERYVPVPANGTFLRFTRSDGQWAPVPYAIADRFEKVAGLTVESHPECFEYEYPAGYLLDIYAAAVLERA